MNFISCSKWIKRGVAQENPDKVQLTKEELEKLITSTKEELEELDEDEEAMEEEGPQASTSKVDEYEWENYDNNETKGTQLGLNSLVMNDDEYLLDEEHDSEEEDEKIQTTDNLIAVGHIDGDASVLEVFVYNDTDGDMYVHHEILLPAIPLCLEWLSFDPGDSKPGNLIAVGGMSAVIAIWDLDIVNTLEPAYKLGKFSVKKKRNKSFGHKDAVLDIAWNKQYKHILASCSVDKTVLLWDLESGTVSTTFAEFADKVHCIKWQPTEYHLLLSGSGDKTAKLFDCRMTETKDKWVFDEEIEKVSWCPWDDNKIYFGTNEGNVINYDIRQNKQPLWSIKAHKKEITGLELDVNCANYLFTCSMDETVKIWDIESDSPKLLNSKNLNLEGLQCLDLNPDCPYVACVGGTKKSKNFRVINLQTEILQKTTEIPVDTSPVVIDESARLTATQNALDSLSIKNKKIKSKKKFGHKLRN